MKCIFKMPIWIAQQEDNWKQKHCHLSIKKCNCCDLALGERTIASTCTGCMREKKANSQIMKVRQFLTRQSPIYSRRHHSTSSANNTFKHPKNTASNPWNKKHLWLFVHRAFLWHISAWIQGLLHTGCDGYHNARTIYKDRTDNLTIRTLNLSATEGSFLTTGHFIQVKSLVIEKWSNVLKNNLIRSIVFQWE